MKYQSLIDHYGSAAAAAAAISITRQAVHRWKEAEIPIEQQIAFEVQSNGKLTADLPASLRGKPRKCAA